MYLAYKGIRSCIRNGHDSVFLVSFIGYLIVGSGSFFFHSTLKCMFMPNTIEAQHRIATSKYALRELTANLCNFVSV